MSGFVPAIAARASLKHAWLLKYPRVKKISTHELAATYSSKSDVSVRSKTSANKPTTSRESWGGATPLSSWAQTDDGQQD
eukprot:4031654-Prymnesium_polylepis.1